MNCACAVSCDMENEGSAWGVREVKKARKTHKCYECRGIISAGSSYFYHTIFGEGTISNFKVCPDCQSVIRQFFDNGWMFGSVWDSLGEYLWGNWREDLPSSCICKLPPGARNKVCDLLEDIHSR